ncbi:hypothetical protein [Mesorhizobium erdmanii]|uniref:hypothetical protein n=1 Tax=Mesorhizobium erdmanii TaxID=1777866 RepID=UPI0012DB769B|nr:MULTISPECIES: hypothetical protein [Mesorhizobium]
MLGLEAGCTGHCGIGFDWDRPPHRPSYRYISYHSTKTEVPAAEESLGRRKRDAFPWELLQTKEHVPPPDASHGRAPSRTDKNPRRPRGLPRCIQTGISFRIWPVDWHDLSSIARQTAGKETTLPLCPPTQKTAQDVIRKLLHTFRHHALGGRLIMEHPNERAEDRRA